MKTVISRVIFGFGVGSLIALLVHLLFRTPESHQLNYLKSAVYDLEHPTPANENIRAIECDGWADRAAAWREKKMPEALVAEYESGCKKAPARERR